MSAREVISGLIQRGVPEHIALGIAGNIAIESGFDAGINEVRPLVPGSRGGFGLYQVTGPRRRQYEAFARERGVNLDDVDTQLDFMLWELNNTERDAAQKLNAAKTPEEAARVFSQDFLRPGIPHLDRRIAETRKLSGGGFETPTPENVLTRGTDFNPQVNALAPPQLALNNNQLDPRDFMTAPRPVNRLAFNV